VGEKYLDKRIATVTSDCNDDHGWTDGWDNDTICFGADGLQPDGNIGTCGLIFGSNHINGMQVVRADGSVGLVKFTVNLTYFTMFNQITAPGVIDWSSF